MSEITREKKGSAKRRPSPKAWRLKRKNSGKKVPIFTRQFNLPYNEKKGVDKMKEKRRIDKKHKTLFKKMDDLRNKQKIRETENRT